MRRRLSLLALALLTMGARAPQLAEDRARLLAAKRDAAAAAEQAAQLGLQAARERSSAERARRQQAALAAQVEASAAQLRAAEARMAIVERLLAQNRATLGDAQLPVARLLAALQSLALRPAAAAIAQPGSVDDLVHVRAVLGASIPLVRASTASIRGEIDRTRALQHSAVLAAEALRSGRAKLEADRVALATLEARHRAQAARLGRGAMSESDRALALGERARDLIDQMEESDVAQATAGDLGRIAPPVPRPLAPGSIPLPPPRGVYRLPVSGRLVTGFDELADAGFRARGLTFVVDADAPVRAPAGGTIVYAGRFRDYGRIAIIDHGDGWSTLLTGLSTLGVERGARVGAGTLVGRAGDGEAPRITVELRRRGRPVDIAALAG